MNDKTMERMRVVAEILKERAGRMLWDGIRATFDGQEIPTYTWMQASTADVAEVNSRVMFTRDTAHHSSGWLKNPDYERCWHLSVSGFPPKQQRIIVPEIKIVPASGPPPQSDLDADVEKAWVQLFFGENAKYVWRESAKSTIGHAKSVWHYRVFADENWQAINPRGEVYSTEFTELGWKSWSELHAAGKGPEVVSTVDPS